jgi:hypothetical protein
MYDGRPVIFCQYFSREVCFSGGNSVTKGMAWFLGTGFRVDTGNNIWLVGVIFLFRHRCRVFSTGFCGVAENADAPMCGQVRVSACPRIRIDREREARAMVSFASAKDFPVGLREGEQCVFSNL